MAKYPDEIYEPREKENRAGVVYDPNKKTVIFVEDIKALDDEVKAIETELGTNPRGNFNSVKEFLQYLLSKVKDYFTDLLDVPHSYSGQAGKVLKVKQTEDGLECGEAGAKKFIDLEDTPSSYTGQAGKVVAIKQTEDGLEFILLPAKTTRKFTAGENIQKGEPVYLASDGKLHPCDALFSTKINFIGFAQDDIANNNDGVVILKGIADIFSGLTIGAVYYIQDRNAIDQRQTEQNTEFSNVGWQSFTPSKSNLSAVSLYLREIRGVPTNTTITIRIYTGEGTGGQLLAEKTFSVSLAANEWRVVTFFFDSPVTITSGSLHTIYFQSSASNVVFRQLNSNYYPNGRADNNAVYDYYFITYYFVGQTNIGTSPGTNNVKVGVAISATEILMV